MIRSRRAFTALLQRWYATELAALASQPPWPARRLVMGFPLWGDAFIDRFLRFCLPSLLAPGNAFALRGRCWLVIYYAAADFQRMLDVSAVMTAAGLTPILRQIPDEVMAHAGGGNFNWILGTVHKVLIQMAARCGAAFTMAQPDHLYGPWHFENLCRLGRTHAAIAQSGISASETIDRDLGPYRHGDALVIDDRALGDLGFRHLHPQMRMHIMNNRDLEERLPFATWMMWIAEDRLVLQRPHMNAAWLSNELCLRAPMLVPNTLDAELPYFMPDDFYVPAIDDGVGFLEISGPEKSHSMGYLTAREFALVYWDTVKFDDAFHRWLARPAEVPIATQQTFMPMDEIMRQVEAIPPMLMAAKGQAAIDFAEREHFPERPR